MIRRLKAGEVILGDGSYTVTLEKRGYVLANAWTPESSVEHPEAVRQLALEFARAGADITQTYTFFSDDKRLKEWHGDKVPSVSNYEIICILIPICFLNTIRKKPHPLHEIAFIFLYLCLVLSDLTFIG